MEVNMFKRVAFTMYPVEDLERAKEFYSNTLGLGEFRACAGGKWLEFDLPGGGCFAITDTIPDLSPSSNSGGSIAFEVEDLDKVVADLKSKGVEFKLDTFKTPLCKLAVALDTEGNAFTLHKLNRE